jgi:hypothetical protein
VVFLDFVPAGLLAGFLLGGRIQELARFRIRSLWLAYAAIALQVVAFPSGVLPWSTPDRVASVLWLCSYALLTALVVRNGRIPGIAIIGAGQACNLIAIIANGGHMPVTRGALDGAGLTYELRNNSIALAHPHLSWLVDRWAVPAWVPLGNVFSIGDVVIGFGVLVTLAVAMRPQASRRPQAHGERSAGLLGASPSTRS